MSRTGIASLAKVAALLALVAVACDEDGKTAPDTCADPPLEIYDLAEEDPAEPGDQANPCVTPVGDAFSPPAELEGSTGGAPPSTPSDGGAGGDASDAGAGGGA